MSTQQCTHCRQWYVRFTRDFPPRAYCSLKCHDERRKPQPGQAPAPSPLTVMHQMLKHRREVHMTTDLNFWFSCEECDRIEDSYAAAMHAAAA